MTREERIEQIKLITEGLSDGLLDGFAEDPTQMKKRKSQERAIKALTNDICKIRTQLQGALGDLKNADGRANTMKVHLGIPLI